jgi:enoyl-CoA hydratase/carnithine racemase
MLEKIDHGQVRELRLARPPVNALNPELVHTLTQALKQAATESDAVVLSGRDGVFSAGLDVPELIQMNRQGISDFWSSFFQLLETIARSPVPVVAAATGHSPAGGAVMCLFCDYRVMSSGDYMIGLNETQVGLLVPTVIQQALVRLLGPHRSERLMVAGTLMNPQEALRIGFVDKLCEGFETTVSDAIDWCNQLLALPRHAMLGNRAIARTDLCAHFDDFSALGVERLVNGWFSEQTQAALNGLVAKLASKKSD